MYKNAPQHIVLLLVATTLSSCQVLSGQGRPGRGDTAPPTVSLTSSAMTVPVGGPLTLTARAADTSGIARVVFYDRGKKIGEDRAAPYTLTVRAPSTLSGEHIYTAQAFDWSGQDALSRPVPVAIGVSNLLRNSGFQNGRAPWWVAGDPAVTARNGEVCLKVVKPGVNPWDVVFGQNRLGLMREAKYTVSFTARADEPTAFKVLLEQETSPYPAYFDQQVARVTQAARTYRFTFDMTGANDAQASLQFKLGGQKATRVCLSNISVRGPTFAPGPVSAQVNDRAEVRVNQVGYFPGAPKLAAVAYESAVPLAWTLLGPDGRRLARGRSRVFGTDPVSGDFVHQVDFSGFRTVGDGYVLEVGGLRSHPFRIAGDLYASLKYDALAYFYHNRSGIPIEAKYVGNSRWARPAGHLGNRGDGAVTCFAGRDAQGNTWPGCRYTLNAGGGWYDAGDHGRYVVNGGISVWTLMNLYETGLRFSGTQPFADGRLRIPEHANGMNDLLDEARWEMDFLLRMQVPDGQRLRLPVGDQRLRLSNLRFSEVDASGMAHHKLHSEQWTNFPSRPDEDSQRRFLYPPSTAATLNLAATAAQCARVFARVDPAYAQRCLQAARRAWNAAKRNPAVYAYDNFTGGGSYADTTLGDEFYWAAAELYATTGEEPYRRVLRAAGGGVENDLTWWDVKAAGIITLALGPGRPRQGDVRTARAELLRAADAYTDEVPRRGYGLPFSSPHYPWGSNSNVMNRGIILGLAYHLTGNIRYRNAALEGVNYLLGRNPLDKSYVSGYGERPLTNPHHRFWAHARDSRFPAPPPARWQAARTPARPIPPPPS